MAGIAVSASTGVMNSLLSKLSTLLTDQYKQLKGVRKDIEILSRELAHMSAALETLENVEKLDPQTKVWRDMVRETAYDIEDCIDIFVHNLGKGDDRDGLLDKISGKVRKLRDHYKLANKIQELKACVVEQSQSRDKYKIDEVAARPVVLDLQSTHGYKQSLKMLKGLSELMVQGMKLPKCCWKKATIILENLANQVYCKIKEFQCIAFVSVSRSPDIPKILKDMLSGVGYI